MKKRPQRHRNELRYLDDRRNEQGRGGRQRLMACPCPPTREYDGKPPGLPCHMSTILRASSSGEDAGSFVLFETGFAIHDGAALERTVWGEVSGTSEIYGRRNLLLYFEHDDVEPAFESTAPHVELIHPVERDRPGDSACFSFSIQRHPVEVGEPQNIIQPSGQKVFP